MLDQGVQTVYLSGGRQAAERLVRLSRWWVEEGLKALAVTGHATSAHTGDLQAREPAHAPQRAQTLDSARLQLGAAAVLTPTRVCELLPLGETTVMGWLRARGLIRKVAGADVVLWGDVLEAIRDHGLARPAPAPRGATLRRAAL